MLKKKNGDVPIYIAVDATKLARCKWCGSVESKEWIPGEKGLYCSSECSQAENANQFILLFCFSIFIMPFLSLLIGPIQPTTFIIGSAIFILMGTPFLYCGVVGYSKRTKTPQNSRRNEALSDTDLLKALPSAVLCPKCNGNINIEKISEDREYACEYCGASGTIEIIKSD